MVLHWLDLSLCLYSIFVFQLDVREIDRERQTDREKERGRKKERERERVGDISRKWL